jgi:hypothetical protein
MNSPPEAPISSPQVVQWRLRFISNAPSIRFGPSRRGVPPMASSPRHPAYAPSDIPEGRFHFVLLSSGAVLPWSRRKGISQDVRWRCGD